MSKYSCRECSIRERCIDQSNTVAYIKNMITNAFNSRTDTVSTWTQLQKNCLWVKEAKISERREREVSQLSLRLQKVREAKEEPAEAPDEEATQSTDETEQNPSMIPSSPEPATIIPPHPKQPPIIFSDPIQPETPTPQIFHPDPDESDTRSSNISQLKQRIRPKPSTLWWLTLNDSRRHISLPITGKLVLGRFDPGSKSPLDVDLTYEDRNTLCVSRRHAHIVGIDGCHTVEDMDSSNGVFVNGERIAPHHPQPLRSGNCIALGSLKMCYDKMSADFLDTVQVGSYLFLTHTGRKMKIAPPNNIIIGRADPTLSFVPSIDLSQDEKVTAYVSRRHARITWSIYGPHLTDLGSTCGTRLNGKKIASNRAVLLKPGDHISLGGCVLAYDVET